MKSLEASPRTKELHIARRGIIRFNESRKVADSEENQAEFELLDAKETVKNLTSRIEEFTSRLNERSRGMEKPKKTKKGGNSGPALGYSQHSRVMTELGYAKEEQSNLKQDMISILKEKRKAEQEIEASNLKMQSLLSKVEALKKEVDELNEEIVLVELARIEAVKELREIEAQRREKAEQHSTAMDENRKRMNDMIEQIQLSKELQEKLASTTSDICVLESELKQVKNMDGRIQRNGLRVESDFLEKNSSVLQSLKEELETAKKELASLKTERFQFMASIDIMRNEIKGISEETAELKKKGSKVDLIIQNLNMKCLKTNAKVEAASSNEEKATSIISKLSLTLEQLRLEAETAKKEGVLIIEETAKVKEEIQETESKTDLSEERLKIAIEELENVKLSEAAALDNLKTLIENTVESRASASNDSSTITISAFEYEYLRGRAAMACDIADKKVAAAQAWIKALEANEREISIKTEIAEREIRELKMDEEQEAMKTEFSVSTKIMVDMELQKWEQMNQKKLDQSKGGLPRKSMSIIGLMTPSRRSKSRKSAPPGARTPRLTSLS